MHINPLEQINVNDYFIWPPISFSPCVPPPIFASLLPGIPPLSSSLFHLFLPIFLFAFLENQIYFTKSC